MSMYSIVLDGEMSDYVGESGEATWGQYFITSHMHNYGCKCIALSEYDYVLGVF